MSWIEVDQYGRPKNVGRIVAGADPVNLQSGDSLEITSTFTFTDKEQFDRVVHGTVTFEDLIERIQELTGLNPRRASVVAGEVIEVGVHPEPSWPDHLIVAKAKELGYLSDSWRLP